MDISTLIAALAEVKAICAGRKACAGCPLELTHGCRARVPDEDMDDYPANWAVGGA